MAFRFSDNTLNNLEESGFVIRNRVPRSMMVIIIFMAAFDLVSFSAYLIHDNSVTATFLCILLFSMGSLCALIFYFINRFQRLILITEFQTALLASAAQIGTRFCFIVNTEGIIFYIDPGFQQIFPALLDSGNRTVWDLLSFVEAPSSQTQKVLDALKNGKNDQIILSFNDKTHQPLTVMVSIDVIARPRGYFVIRGRNYVEKRASIQSSANPSDIAYMAKALAQTVSSLSGWLVVADPTGKIISISRELEQWLGYDAEEMVSTRLPVRRLFHRYGNNDEGVMLLEEYKGAVTLRKKDGKMLGATIAQHLLKEGDKTLGISAIVDPSSVQG